MQASSTRQTDSLPITRSAPSAGPLSNQGKGVVGSQDNKVVADESVNDLGHAAVNDGDSQVIQAIKRTQEVSLLSLGIQGLKQENKCSTVFGKCVPGSGDKVYLQYKFTAKLGIDGARAKVTKSGEHNYVVAIPEFISIGFSDPTFEVAVTDGGALAWITPDIDEVDMVNEILNDDAREQYIESNKEILEDQARVFYDSLIIGIDPDAKTKYEFDS